MNKKRLRILEKRLRTIAKKQEQRLQGLNPKLKRKFDLSCWVRESSCGTAACALGEACFIPSFQKAGLELHFVEHNGYNIGVPSFENAIKYQAGAKFFDINYGLARRLFDPLAYVVDNNPLLVANRIKALIETGVC